VILLYSTTGAHHLSARVHAALGQTVGGHYEPVGSVNPIVRVHARTQAGDHVSRPPTSQETRLIKSMRPTRIQ